MKERYKQIQVDVRKLKQAQKILRAENADETIRKAIDLVVSEHRRNRKALKANQRFISSGIQIQDVFGRLEN